MNAPAGAPGSERLSRPMAGRQLGRYEILTQLASGGMASVYIARAQGVAGFERLVAIKVLHPHLAYEQEFISMFLDEARLAARIRHMNVVPTLDISDSPGDGYFLVMEYIEGNHLGALLGRAAKKGERLPRPFVCRVLVDTLQGLGAAHRLTDEHGRPLKLVHRDVSPHNILIGTDGIARLTDFGVAKADVRMASTRAGQFKGKLSYMAPEQASSNETDQRSDLFSVGIILWESLTGRRLFKGESNAATLNKLLNDTIARPSELWPDLEPFDDVVMKALSRNPEGRRRAFKMPTNSVRRWMKQPVAREWRRLGTSQRWSAPWMPISCRASASGCAIPSSCLGAPRSQHRVFRCLGKAQGPGVGPTIEMPALDRTCTGASRGSSVTVHRLWYGPRRRTPGC
jgi:serine/threonine-protein kinase